MKKTLTILIFGLITNIVFAKNIIDSTTFQTTTIIGLKQSINTVNTRIDDLYTNLTIWVIAILVVIGGILVTNFYSARGVARKQAEKEFEKVVNKYSKELDIITQKKDEIEDLLNTLKLAASNVSELDEEKANIKE